MLSIACQSSRWHYALHSIFLLANQKPGKRCYLFWKVNNSALRKGSYVRTWSERVRGNTGDRKLKQDKRQQNFTLSDWQVSKYRIYGLASTRFRLPPGVSSPGEMRKKWWSAHAVSPAPFLYLHVSIIDMKIHTLVKCCWCSDSTAMTVFYFNNLTQKMHHVLLSWAGHTDCRTWCRIKNS